LVCYQPIINEVIYSVKKKVNLLTAIFSVRYQDVHNQSFISVKASGRWLGVRLDLLGSILIGAVSLAAVLVSQDAGRCIYKINIDVTNSEGLPVSKHAYPVVYFVTDYGFTVQVS